MADVYVKSGSGVQALTNRAWSVGERMVPALADSSTNHLIAKRWVWECTTAGTTTGTPTWPASVTQDTTTVTQNGAVFTARRPGFSSGSTANWSFATIFLLYASYAAMAGDTVYVSQSHDCLYGSATTTRFSNGTLQDPIRVLCVDDSAAPPTSLATGARTGTNVNAAYTFGGNVYVYGLRIASGVTNNGGSAALNAADAGFHQHYESCELEVATTSAVNMQLFSGGTTTPGSLRLTNCTIKFNNTGGRITSQTGFVDIEGGALAGAAITSLFAPTAGAGRSTVIRVSGFDLSVAAANMAWIASNNGPIKVLGRNIRLPSGYNGAGNSGAWFQGQELVLDNVDDGVTNYRKWVEDFTGSIKHDSGIYLTATRVAGTPISHRFASSANCNFASGRLYGPEMHFVVTDAMVGNSVTATVEIALDSATAINDDDCWLELMYPGSSSHPLGTWISDAKSNILATGAAQTSSSEAWTGTGGWSNLQRRKLQVTFTPQMAGMYPARVVMGKPSTTLYVDPDVRLA